MNDFNRFNLPRERVDTRTPIPEYPDSDDRVYKRKSYLILKITAFVLLALIVLYLLNAIFINPLKELNLRTAIGGSCRIRITVQQPYSYDNTITIKVNKNLISIKENRGQPQYYEVDGDQVYEFVQGFDGSWRKLKRPDNLLGIQNNESKALENLLDPSNYERADGKLFTWTIKNGVYIGSYYNVELKRKFGKVTITAMNGFAKLTFKFDRIGFTGVDEPWED